MHCNTNDFPPPGCDAALPGEGAHPAYFRPQIALVANKRVRLSPPPSRSSTPTPGGSIDGNTNQTQAEDMMEVAAGKDVSGDSDASSDWGDWADAMVATDDEPAKQTAAAAAITSRGNMGGLSGEQEEEEAWVRSMIEQGTDGSVVQDADSRAWDYVLQMAVQERGRSLSGPVTDDAGEEVKGTAATEYVARWLRHTNLPIAQPALRTLSLVASDSCLHGENHHRDHQYGRRGGTGGVGDGCPRGRCLAGRAVVDSVAQPSAVAVVYRSTEQTMHRMALFSLSANAGAALTAAVVQPGAAGLNIAFKDPNVTVTSNSIEGAIAASGGRCGESDTRGGSSKSRKERGPGGVGGFGYETGVVFESLDSRILEEALVSSMARLGLGISRRSRSGMWKLPPGAMLDASGIASLNGVVCPLSVEDAGLIARSATDSLPQKKDGGDASYESWKEAEALARGLISRNPSACVRREGRLVAWCLSFDNGLAGALHVSTPETAQAQKENDTSQVVLALLRHLLCRPADGKSPPQLHPSSLAASINSNAASLATPGIVEEEKSGRATDQSGNDHSRIGGIKNCIRSSVEGFVLDDDSPFLEVFQELRLERVCDADWIRFEPSALSSKAPLEAVEHELRGCLVVPVAALAMHP